MTRRSSDGELPAWAQVWLQRHEYGEKRVPRSGSAYFRNEIRLEKPPGENWQLFADYRVQGNLTQVSNRSWKLTDSKIDVTRFALSRSGSHAWWFQEEKRGSESGHWLYLKLPGLEDPSESPVSAPMTVPGLPSGFWYGGIQTGFDVAVIGMAVNDEIQIYRVPAQGEAVKIRNYPPLSQVKAVSPDGKLAAISHIEGSTPLRPVIDILNLETGEIRQLPPSRAVFTRSAEFSPDSRRLLFQEERNNWLGLSIVDLSEEKPYRLPINIGKPADLEGIWLPEPPDRPLLREDLFSSGTLDEIFGDKLTLEDLGKEVLFDNSLILNPSPPESLLIVARHGMTTSLHLYEIDSGKTELLSNLSLRYLPYGEGEIAQPSVGQNGNVTFLTSSMEKPSELVTIKAFSPPSNSLMLDVSSEIKIPRSTDSEPEIPIRVHTPDGKKPAGGWPTVFLPHGGPHLQDWEGHDDTIDVLRKSGYAVVTVNYRGSTGYGADWVEALRDNPGFGELEDIAAAREWLVSQGLVDPDRCAIMGASWGGHLAALAAATQPGLWRVAIAHAPLIDLVQEYELMTPTLRQVFTHRYRGSPTDNPELYRKCSPSTYAEQLKCPMYITVGSADPRSFDGPIRDFAYRANSSGGRVVLKILSSGHFISDTHSRIATMMEVLDVLKSHTRPIKRSPTQTKKRPRRVLPPNAPPQRPDGRRR